MAPSISHCHHPHPHHRHNNNKWNAIKIAVFLVVIFSIFGRLNILQSVNQDDEGSSSSFAAATIPNMMLSSSSSSEKSTSVHGPQPMYKSPVIRPKLPSISSSWTSFENVKELPAFTWNNEQFMLGSTLTRDDRLNSLFVDMHFMGVKAVTEGGTTFGKIRDGDADWEKASTNMLIGVREKVEYNQASYECTFTLPYGVSYDGKPVIAQAVNTASTVDGNVNDMTNVLRCEIPAILRNFIYQYKDGDLQVGRYVMMMIGRHGQYTLTSFIFSFLLFPYNE